MSSAIAKTCGACAWFDESKEPCDRCRAPIPACAYDQGKYSVTAESLKTFIVDYEGNEASCPCWKAKLPEEFHDIDTCECGTCRMTRLTRPARSAHDCLMSTSPIAQLAEFAEERDELLKAIRACPARSRDVNFCATVSDDDMIDWVDDEDMIGWVNYVNTLLSRIEKP